MKPSKFSCDAPLVHEWKRVIGDELKLVHEAAMVSMVRDTDEDVKHRAPPSSSARQKLNTYNNQNNNRVIMFLGPWSHT
ncbi:3-methyl-2-oxobutanoate hydroxymethyltransferase [Bienertia sinuspersici]